MKNPLYKRIPKEIKSDLGKYFVIFTFLIIMISAVSSFVVVTNSMIEAYDQSFEKYNIEDGHFSFDQKPSEELLQQISEKGNVSLYELSYINTTIDNDKSVRIYPKRTEVNLECWLSGEQPMKENEIAIDRLFAEKNEYHLGDTIQISGKELVITAFIALPDYSCLFEKNTDMMFNATNFSVAVMTREGIESVAQEQIIYNYAWKYENIIERTNDKDNKESSDAFFAQLKAVVKTFDEKLVEDTLNSGDMEKINNLEEALIKLTDYVPQYQNQAITFTGEDMGSDKGTMIVFAYLLILVIAFVFAVTISNTISKEAGVIGTLRALGYSKSEIIAHYMILPLIVSLLSAIIGNVLGYTVMKQYMVNMYLNSYSLTTYETVWNADAFILTTVVPFVIMFIVNFVTLMNKLQLSPIRFLRHDLSKKGKKKAFRLNTRIPILHRFRLRVIFQNITNYLTLFLGIILGGTIIVFGLMFAPLFEVLKDNILEQRFCEYQYIVTSTQAITNSAQAEKFCMTSLKTRYEDFVEDEVTVYGIRKDSDYVDTSIPTGKVIISTAYSEKYGIKESEKIRLYDSFTDQSYEFEVGGVINYDAALCIFMQDEDFKSVFEKEEDYFTGYFSNEELSDLKEEQIFRMITSKDLTALSDQMLDSMKGITVLFKYFGIVIFMLLMYLLSKQIIEKNTNSISMTKILGFTNGEIGAVYIWTTSIVVVCSLVLACPLIDLALKAIFKVYLYKVISGYMPFIAPMSGYFITIGLGVGCYAVISAALMYKISKIPKTDALKNME